MKIFNYFLICIILVAICRNSSSAQINNALVLDGCTNYFQIPENDLLDFNEVLSIECWIRPNCEDGNKIILGKQWCLNQFGYYLSGTADRNRRDEIFFFYKCKWM